MDHPRLLSRTSASRPIVSSWWIAVLVLAGSGIVGAMSFDTAFGTLALAWPVAGGAIAGLILGSREQSLRSPVRALLAPLILLVPLVLLGIGFSETEGDVKSLAEGLAALFALWEVPLAIGYWGASSRSIERSSAAPVPVALGRELAAATADGRIPLVVREYVDDDEGRRHLAADTARLAGRGYDVVSVEHRSPGAALAAAGIVTGLLGAGDVAPDPKIIASFRLRSWNGPSGEAAFHEATGDARGVAGVLLDLGRDALVVLGWLIGAVIVVVAISLVVTRLPLRDTWNAAAGLAMVGVFATMVVVGPILTIRRLDRRDRTR